MTWDKLEPQDTTKIRNLGVVIRPNWEAIEDADSTFKPKAMNLQNRTPLVEPNDPVAIAATNILYAKDDASANSELFMMDENSNAIQLTKGIPIIGTIGETFLPGGLLMKWGFLLNPGLSGSIDYVASGLTVFPTATLNVQMTMGPGVKTGSLSSFTNAKFDYVTDASGAANNLYWVAYGH